MPSIGARNVAEQTGYFRSIFEHKTQTYAISFYHSPPARLDMRAEVDYSITLEQGCQKYRGRAAYTPGALMVSAKSAYFDIPEMPFPVLNLHFTVDQAGAITAGKLMTPDGTIHELNYDVTTPPSTGPKG